MKISINKIKVFLIICTSLAISCSENFIDLAPISNSNVNTFYKTQSDFETAVVSVYSSWQTIFNTQWTEYNEFRGDTYSHHQYSYYEISSNNFTLNTTSSLWNNLYKIVSNANIILDKIDQIETFDEAVRNEIKAECRFFRAEAYFALVRFFGTVPLVEHEITSQEALKIGRTDVTTVFSLIEEDYKYAIDYLPSGVDADDYGQITKYAAEGELARVYITLSGKVYNKDRWTDAKPLLEDIINNSPFEFAETYQEIFADDGSNEKGKEFILAAVFKAGGDGESTDYQRQFVGRYFGGPDFEEGVIGSYEMGDIRKEVNIAPNYTTIEGVFVDEPTNVKFDWGYDIGSSNSGMDFPILRFTDIYLLYSETLAEIANSVPGKSLDILNEVRNRANLSSLTAADVPDIASFRMAMERERRSELMFECVRWFDLVRTGRAVEVLRALGKDADETWLLFPIPQTEIDKVGSDLLPQNPGY